MVDAPNAIKKTKKGSKKNKFVCLVGLAPLWWADHWKHLQLTKKRRREAKQTWNICFLLNVDVQSSGRPRCGAVVFHAFCCTFQIIMDFMTFIKFCIPPDFLFNHVTFPLKAFSRWRWDVFGVSTFCPWNHLALHSQRIGKRVGTYPEIPSQNSVFIYIYICIWIRICFCSWNHLRSSAKFALHIFPVHWKNSILFWAQVHRKVVTMDNGKVVSPSLCINASCGG